MTPRRSILYRPAAATAPPSRPSLLQRAAWAALAGLVVLGVPLYLLAWALAPP
jgi:hypothetical protein